MSTRTGNFVRVLRADRMAMVGGIVVLIYCLVAVIGPEVVRVTTTQNPALAYHGASWLHPLGTDPFGNGVLTEVIVGTRAVMIVGLLAAIFSVTVGVLIGLVSGYVGGIVDTILMRIADVFLSIPGLPLVIVIASIIHTSSPLALAGIVSIQSWAGLSRTIRSQAISLRSSAYIEAARSQGVPLRHMIGRQLLPNVGPYVAINFLLSVTGAIYAQVGLYVLGVAPVSGTNWGVMLNIGMGQGALYTGRSALYMLSPMMAIVILQVAFVLLSRGLDNVLNPRLRVAA